jgi:NAD(P)-dependent dehydrogenase (short-subunit alcohol dehydrogenase family)
VVDKTLAEYGRVDMLFNNAGVVMGGRAEDTTEEDWQYTLDLNVTAVWRMCRLVIPHMRSQGGGVIVNNASDWGVVGARGAVVYCVSKGAVVQPFSHLSFQCNYLIPRLESNLNPMLYFS